MHLIKAEGVVSSERRIVQGSERVLTTTLKYDLQRHKLQKIWKEGDFQSVG